MYKSFKILASAALLSATASVVSAAPVTMSPIPGASDNGLTLVQRHRYERSCHRGPGGWYRWGRDGRRHSCREWHGNGRRPNSCVKFGPVWFCDY